MQLNSESFQNGATIPGEFAFAIPAAVGHIALSTNHNPQLSWSDVPEGTQSFVLICHDPDVPSRGDDVNQEGRTVAAELHRVDFQHWLLLDIPGTTREIAATSQSSQVSPGGKPGPQAPHGLRHGINSYTQWFAGDPQMQGDYYGYDGPCPPWNDALIHRYVFTLYALDCPRLEIDGRLDAAKVLAALAAAPVLASASLVGYYSLNPEATTRND